LTLLIIPDEWLIHDLIGENGENKQRETINFLEKVYIKCDKLVILSGSPFNNKVYKLLFKDSRVHVRKISKFFYLKFLINSEKCIKLDSVKELPENIKDKVPEEDRYLFQIRETLQEGIIVTTDEGLQKFQGVKCMMNF